MCMAVAFVLVLGLACHGVSSKNQQPSKDNAEQPVRQQTSGTSPALQSTASTVQMPHEKTAAETWNEASPSIRRLMLASQIGKTWKNVRVEHSGPTMTITHPGMDEKGAQQMIADISALAASAGLKRINFVRSGGMCQVTYQRPYCEIAGPVPGDDETGGTGCGPYEGHSGNGWTSTMHTTVEQCPPHTWVYDVPRS
jgi:hypothetical protein